MEEDTFVVICGKFPPAIGHVKGKKGECSLCGTKIFVSDITIGDMEGKEHRFLCVACAISEEMKKNRGIKSVIPGSMKEDRGGI